MRRFVTIAQIRWLQTTNAVTYNAQRINKRHKTDEWKTELREIPMLQFVIVSWASTTDRVTNLVRGIRPSQVRHKRLKRAKNRRTACRDRDVKKWSLETSHVSRELAPSMYQTGRQKATFNNASAYATAKHHTLHVRHLARSFFTSHSNSSIVVELILMLSRLYFMFAGRVVSVPQRYQSLTRSTSREKSLAIKITNNGQKRYATPRSKQDFLIANTDARLFPAAMWIMDRRPPGSHIVSNTELYNGAGAWRLICPLHLHIFSVIYDWMQNYLFQITIIKIRTEIILE